MRFLYAMKIMEQETSWLDFYLSQIRLPFFGWWIIQIHLSGRSMISARHEF